MSSTIGTLGGKFPAFPLFWNALKDRLADDYRPKGRINAVFLARCVYNYFRNWPFWEDEEDGIESVMTLLSLIAAETQQRDIIQDKVYSQIEEFFTTSTRTRKVTRTSEDRGRKITNFEEPLINLPDMTQKSFGGHLRENWTKQTQKNDTVPEVQISEGILTVDEQGKKIMKPNWSETDDPAAVARLINSFSGVEIEFKQFLPRFLKAGIFLRVFSPSVEIVWDEELQERKWKSKREIIQEKEEKDGEITRQKIDEDDITEKEYLRLKVIDPSKVAENWQVERFTRRKKRLEKEIKSTSGVFKDKLMMRLNDCEAFIEMFKKVHKMPELGEENEKLSIIATQIEWDQASYWSRINRTIGYKKIKNTFASFIKGYNKATDQDIALPQKLFLLTGHAGVGKTHIVEMIAEALDLPVETISMNGKKDTSIFFGVPQEYAGGGTGEVIKAMVRFKNNAMVLIFDEIDKCAKDVQQVLGNITDKKLNKKFKDVFEDYPVPINKLIIFATANYPEQIEGFLFSRFTPVEVQDPNYAERIEIANDYINFEFNRYKINHLRNKVTNKLVNKFLTWEWGVRGLMSNIESFAWEIFSMEDNNIPDDWDNYNWPITQKLEIDAGNPERNRLPCPVSISKKNAGHSDGCECFKPEEIEGWVVEMGKEYPKS